jgi:hypothetical protein
MGQSIVQIKQMGDALRSSGYKSIDSAVAELDKEVRQVLAASGNSCSKTEAALLCALDYSTQRTHLAERVKELETKENAVTPMANTYESNLLRGENEALRAELAVERGRYEALLQDNATLFQLNAKLVRQNSESNARADRMHDQVLSMLTEVHDLRQRLSDLNAEPRPLSPSYTVNEPEPDIEITPAEQQITHKYEQMDIDAILATAPLGSYVPEPANPLIDDTENEEGPDLSDLLYFDGNA